MALKATIFKAELHVADMGRNYFQQHLLTIARHPSETDERMMMRLLGFALHAHEWLAFGKGLSSDDEPDLWQKDLTGAIELWIEVGQPDEKVLRKACGRAKQVCVYSYGLRSVDLWWSALQPKLERTSNLSVYNVPLATSAALAALASRNMQIQCTIQDGHIWFANAQTTVQVEAIALMQSATLDA